VTDAPKRRLDVERPYRRGVGILLFNHAGQVFVGQRNDMAGSAWQMPQGGIDEGEEPDSAAHRELNEETGVPPNLAEIVGQTSWIRYDLPEGLSQTAWKGRFRGQEQIWFAMRFVGTDADVDLDADGHAAEFRAWHWVAVARLPTLAVPFKRGAYRRVLAELAPLVHRTA